jgi:hypothetical protein
MKFLSYSAVEVSRLPPLLQLPSAAQPPHTRHNTSPKHKEHKQGENAVIYLQANKTYTSIQVHEESQRNTSVGDTHLHITTTNEADKSLSL